MVVDIVPTPVWSVNAPTALIRCNATGKRNFLFFELSLKFLGESSLSRTLLTYCLTSF